jgi:hypothetical protein
VKTKVFAIMKHSDSRNIMKFPKYAASQLGGRGSLVLPRGPLAPPLQSVSDNSIKREAQRAGAVRVRITATGAARNPQGCGCWRITATGAERNKGLSRARMHNSNWRGAQQGAVAGAEA